MKVVLIPALAVCLAACAARPEPAPATPQPQPQAPPAQAQAQQAPAFDPVGVYDFTTEIQGTSIRGTLTLRRGDQGITGSISTDVTGEMPLQQVSVDGRRAELRASTPEGGMIMRVEFPEGDRLTGGWELSSGLSGTVVGQRRRQ